MLICSMANIILYFLLKLGAISRLIVNKWIPLSETVLEGVFVWLEKNQTDNLPDSRYKDKGPIFQALATSVWSNDTFHMLFQKVSCQVL